MFKPISIHIKNITTHKDTFFEFHQSEPLLVNGENLDDKGQKGNGAGKSGINEAVSLAIAGKTIRNVPMKELVSDNEVQGEITLVLYNSILNKNLNIKRTIYSNTKTQECLINYDGEKPIVKGNVLQYSDWIFDEIGISEDDFFSFYLITKENYKPFFSMTDVPKKTIINRFSGANEIDKVDPYIKNDISKKESEKIEVDKKIVSEQTKIELYKKQVEDLTVSDEDIESKEFELVNELTEIEGSIELLNHSIEKDKTDILVVEKEIKNFKNIYIPQIEKKKTEVEELEKDITSKKSDIKKVEEKYSQQISSKKTEKQQIGIKYSSIIKTIKDSIVVEKNERTEFENELNKTKSEITKLNNQLVDSITCPECSHEFNLQDKDFVIEICKNVTIPGLEEEVKLFETEIESINKKIEIYNQKLDSEDKNEINETEVVRVEIENLEEKIEKESLSIKTEIKKLETLITLLEGGIRDLNTKKLEEDRKLQNLQSSKNNHEFDIKNSEQKIKNLNLQLTEIEKQITQLGVIDQEKLDSINNVINISESNLKKLEELQQEVTDELLRLNTWLLNFKKFKSFLANRSISNITDYTNLFLQLIGSDLSINVEGYRTLSDGKTKEELSTMVLRNGLTVGRYGRFSAGERVRIDFSNILALQEICNINAKVGLDLLLIDEVLDSCDGEGMSCIIEGTSELKKTIMIISQVETKSNNKIKIIKENGVSRIG